jgi:tetratricopeptide (TPR) repeat protein
MEAEVGDAALDSPARRLLTRQERLVAWQIASERAGVALKVLTALAGLAVAAALALMAWDASRSNSLVIEAFSTPPDLAQRGLTGEVIASRILDRMTEIQAGVDSQRAPSSFARAWDGEIKVEIPQTGVNLSELRRELRAALGHDTHISGEVVRTSGGLTLTVRTGARSGATFTAPEDQLDALIRRGADAAFERTQPYRYAVYLRAVDLSESDRVLRDMTRQGSLNDQAWAYLGIALNAKEQQGTQAALPMVRIAEDLSHEQSLPPLNAGFYELEIGHPEAARAEFLRAKMTANPRGQVRAELIEAFHQRVLAALDMTAGDFAAAERAWTRAIAFGRQGLNQSITARQALSCLGLHEVAAARADLDRPDPTNPRQTGTTAMDRLTATLSVDIAAEAWGQALADAGQADTILERAPGANDQKSSRIDPLVAYAKARSGDVAGAQALIATTPLDSYDAVIMRGRIAALAGDGRLADYWFGEAMKMAPSIGFAPTNWAEALLARGDPAGAIAKAARAAANAPRFGDPLEVWGEALLAQGDAKGAAAKFTEAARLAPRWGRLHLKWGEALAAQGKAGEAPAQWRAAATMDLSAADRARVEALLRKSTT